LHANKLYAPWVGGVEAVVQALAEETARLPGFEVEVLACQPRGPAVDERWNGLRVRRVASRGLFMSTPLAPGYPAALQRALPDFDVVHLHLPFPLPLLTDWRVSPSTRLVIHFHADVTRPVQRAIYRLAAPLQARLFDRADAVVVTSQRLLDRTAMLAPWRDRCRVIPLPADVAGARPLDAAGRATWRARLGLPAGRRVVLFVGRLVGYKGVAHLLEAMRGVDALLLVGGDGPLRGDLERRAARLGVAERVRFLGRLDDDTLHAAYQLADLFVLPSCTPAEAFGLVQLEAMMYGCPVLNTDLPTGVPEVSVHGETGETVPPGRPAALREAMARLLADDPLRRRYGEAARRRVARFDRARVARAVADLYLELRARPAPRAG
jgi:rhamnosyl/mannosyltransferase